MELLKQFKDVHGMSNEEENRLILVRVIEGLLDQITRVVETTSCLTSLFFSSLSFLFGISS